MEQKESAHQSLEARIDELERQLDRIANAAAESRLHAKLEDLRARLAATRSRLRKREEADEEAEDAILAEIGRGVADLTDAYLTWPEQRGQTRQDY